MKKGVDVDPQTLMAIQNLELRAKAVVEGYLSGLHRSPYHGFSVEFTEYRQYVPGDDPRYLDWKLYGRSDRYYIKKFEDETNLRCYLLVDNSRSMEFGSLSYSKASYAKTLAATLGYFFYLQGDAVGMLSFDEHIREYLPPRNRPGHLRRLIHALEADATGRSTNVEKPLQRMAELARKRGLIVLISDLLMATEGLENRLKELKANGHELIVFHLLDPQEVRFDYHQPIRFQDVETGQELFIDPTSCRDDYLNRFEAHLKRVEEIASQSGAVYSRLKTDDPLDWALYELLRRQNQPGRTVKRRANHRRQARSRY